MLWLCELYLLSMKTLNPLGMQDTEVHVLFLFCFVRSKMEEKMRYKGPRAVYKSLSEIMIQIETYVQSLHLDSHPPALQLVC